MSSKLDQEKDEKLQAISSRDKLQKRVFLLEEDIKKFQEKLSQKILLSERLEKDLNELRLQISIKEENIKGLYKKIDERFEENLELSQKHKEDLAKLTSDYEEIKRNTENEKNKIIDKLLLEIESLNETKSKNLREIDNNKRNILALNEELRDTKEHNSDLIRRIERLEFETQGFYYFYDLSINKVMDNYNIFKIYILSNIFLINIFFNR